MKNALSCVALVLGLALTAWPSQADKSEHRRTRVHRHHYHGYSLHLPRERHVIEVVRGAYGPNFIINGRSFSAKSPAACIGWTAGDRIRLLAGSWNGACVDAAFYNMTRHRTCEMWCG